MRVRRTDSRIRWAIAGLFLIGAVLLSFVLTRLELECPLREAEAILIVSSLFAVISVLLEIRMSERVSMFFSYIILVISPVVTFIAIESLQQSELEGFVVFINLLCYFAVYLLVYLITERVYLTVIICSLLFAALSIANYYMLVFRDAPLLPWDIFLARTALSVASSFSLPVNRALLWTFGGLLILLGLLPHATYRVKGKRKRLFSAGRKAGVIAVLCLTLFFTLGENKTYFNVSPWFKVESVRQNGFAANFVMNVKNLIVQKPKGYSLDKVRETVLIEDTGEEAAVTAEGKKKPHIIAILNESFSQLDKLPNLNASEEITPFFDSLKENAIHGNIAVPVYGGGTCNTEYEFLTGNICDMLRTGSHPLQEFVVRDSPSIASTLKDQGYQTFGVHPYYGLAWNRNRAYPFLGIDTFLDITQFEGAEYYRGFISDRADYQKVIELYENRGDDPLFIFNVTMQNHGGYPKDESLAQETGLSISTYKDEQFYDVIYYLDEVRESDRALEELVSYFQQQEEEVVIVFFGDHYPPFEDSTKEALRKLAGMSNKEFTDIIYKPPFFIWANYDIDEAEGLEISVQYLSTLALEVAGVEMTAYNKYLSSLMKQFPVINSRMIVDAQGDQYLLSDEKNGNPYTDVLESYRMVQYNQVFGKKKRIDELFYLQAK